MRSSDPNAPDDLRPTATDVHAYETANAPVGCAGCSRPFTPGSACYCPPDRHRHGPLMRRSARTVLVVGTILVAINQGIVLATGEFLAALLTYLVPFFVASWDALGAARR